MHIEAISATTLAANYNAAQSVINQSLWNSVVLQDASFEPITYALSRNHASAALAFCTSVQTVEQGIHAVAPNANVYMYSTWAPADTGYLDATANGAAFSSATYLQDLNTLTAAYHDVGLAATSQDGHLAGVAPGKPGRLFPMPHRVHKTDEGASRGYLTRPFTINSRNGVIR